MDVNKEKGSIRKTVMHLLVIAGVLAFTGYMSLAQTTDPCLLYGKTSANIPVGTPTAKLIAGVVGKQIYICAVHVAQSLSTPNLTLSYGEAVAGTPCATSTPGGTIGVYGGAGTTNVGGGTTSLFQVPAAAGTPVVDVCGLVTSGNGITGGSIDYVIVKP